MPLYTGDDLAGPFGIMALLNAGAVSLAEDAWRPDRVHKIGDVPKNPATPYLAVSVSSGLADNRRNGGGYGSKSYRVTAMAVGRNADEVAYAADKAEAAFLERSIPAPDHDTTPAESEVSSPIIRDPDAGGLLSVTLTYTFHAYPTA